MSEAEAEYFSKDFEWDDLRNDVEADPSLRHHLLPLPPPSASIPPPAQDVSDAWGSFHARHHTGKFFKERRYLLKAFPELVSCGKKNPRVLEVGCGNGSTVLPILRGNEGATVFACDCSAGALEYTKEMLVTLSVASIEDRFYPFLCDFSLDGFPAWLACGSCRETSLHEHCCSSEAEEKTEMPLRGFDPSKDSSCLGGVDFITLIFTLSAIPFPMMPKALAECFCVLKPGRLLLFRDYGLYDMTMLRFESGKQLGFREYMRSDGTRSYFFSLEIVRDLFLHAGFIELELEYCCIKSLNRRSGKSMRRVWVHGKFQKPK